MFYSGARNPTIGDLTSPEFLFFEVINILLVEGDGKQPKYLNGVTANGTSVGLLPSLVAMCKKSFK